MSLSILTVNIQYEHDIVAARQRARQIAALLGFEQQDQTRIATAVSEIARNAYNYAGGGRVEFAIEGNTPPQVLLVTISDQGPGISNLAEILAGRYQSQTGMGMGLIGARRLMDQFHVDTTPGQGTTVFLRKLFPRRVALVTPRDLAKVTTVLAQERSSDPMQEIQLQNQELLRTLEELRHRQDELVRLNGELEDTNRGVVALYAELDERADHLRRADEVKSKFLSNMSHEFRTPLNSILALSKMLLDRTDGVLTVEQEKQLNYIRKAAQDLSELVNDLLDLAKVEAGKIVVHPVEFEVANLFGALRGMLRPLLLNESVSLILDEPEGLPPIYNDEAKVSQILRNFISNALKFTERGHVRVSAHFVDGDSITFSVEDTGIGIAPENQELIFQEFTQVEHPLQKRYKGTGLGLPLSKKLAELLGGKITLTSQVGVGSTFAVSIPVRYHEEVSEEETLQAAMEEGDQRIPLLVIEDAPEDLLIYERYLRDTPYRMVVARTLRQARQVLSQLTPQVIILDMYLRGEDSWGFLSKMKVDDKTRNIPIVIVTTVQDYQKGMGLGADDYYVKPIERQELLRALDRLTRARRTILIIDDDEADRYVVKKYLYGLPFEISEAATGEQGIAQATRERPEYILLDMRLPDIYGAEVLQRLKANRDTADIPVVIITSKILGEEEHRRLSATALAILSKANLSREALDKVLNAPQNQPFSAHSA